jgi:hypothetical protein
VEAIAVKNHQSVTEAQKEYTRLMNQQYRAGKLSGEIQFEPIVTKGGVSKKTHKINRYIVRLTAIKNCQFVDEAQKEYTRKIQREYRARKLKESRERGG